jgi:outer membrane protein OmpA-like peptidoglycan-associated protein
VLDQIAATLRAHPEIRKLVIHVHVRGRGDPDGEEKLARRRGEALLGYLERRGVEAGRLEARAHGSRNPLGRAALDERVELTLE